MNSGDLKRAKRDVRRAVLAAGGGGISPGAF
jgi:hypothetical protein